MGLMDDVLKDHKHRWQAGAGERLRCLDCGEPKPEPEETPDEAWNAALEAAANDLCQRAEVAQEFGHIKASEVWRNAASAVSALKRPA